MNAEFNFQVKYPEGYKETDFFNPKDVLSYAPFKGEYKINGENLEYSFKTEIDEEVLYENSDFVPKINKQVKKLYETKGSYLNLGEIKFELHNFYFDRTRTIREYLYDKQMEKKIPDYFLSAYQGINIYRNGFKIYGHGSEDWLKLAELRVSRTAENIDNKQTYGVILLDNDKSNKLEEKSSREGFIKRNHSKAFTELIRLLVRQFGQDRKEAVKVLKKHIEEETAKKKVEEKPEQNKPEKISKNAKSVGENEKITLETKQPETISNQSEEKTKEVTNHSVEESVEKSKKTKRRRSQKKYLPPLNNEVYRSLPEGKIRQLITEIESLNIQEYNYATSYVFRAILEITMNEYLRNNLPLEGSFENYKVRNDGKIVKAFPKKEGGKYEEEPSIKKKINEFQKYLKKSRDSRELKSLEELKVFIDHLNLSIHWNDKIISSEELYAKWMNNKFFIEYLCSELYLSN